MGNGVSNPKNLEILVFRGNNEFTLYEDEGEDNNYNAVNAKTLMTVSEDSNIIDFCVDAAVGDTSVLPESRNLSVSFNDVESGEVTIQINGVKVSTEIFKTQHVIVKDVKSTDKVRIR